MSRANNFVERMAAGREAAAIARHRGRAYGARVRLHEKPSPTITGWEYERQRNLASWRFARGEAIEQFRFDVYGDQWEGLF